MYDDFDYDDEEFEDDNSLIYEGEETDDYGVSDDNWAMGTLDPNT